MSSTSSEIRRLLTAADLPARLAAALGDEPRRNAVAQMAPSLNYGRHAGPAPASARPAAVVLVLYHRDGRWCLPLTERPRTLLRHGGQISLPGGTVEPGESTRDAALRELAEELGVDQGIEMLGRLSDCYVYASDFIVTPWLATAAQAPLWRPDQREVQRVIELPVDVLMDPDRAGQVTIDAAPFEFAAPCYWVNQDFIWGATSVILSQLGVALRRLRCPP